MSKNDINGLGSVYGGMLNKLKKDLIKEGKVGPEDIGTAELQDGGPTEEGGFVEAEIDAEKIGSSEQEENLYNINNLSYTSSYMPEEDEEGVDEEADAEEDEEKPDYIDIDKDGDKEESMKKAVKDAEEDDTEESDSEEDEEESIQFLEKIAQDGLNNFMSKKSYFDKLYENVMGAEYEENDLSDTEELDALGIDDSADSEDGDVTLTLSRDVAQTLCDMIQSALGEGDDEDGDEMSAESDDLGAGDFEEDEEGTGSTLSTAYDDGKNNKVGSLKTQSGASSDVTDKVGNDGDHGHANVNAKAPDMGTSNKVGNLKSGKSAFDK